MPEPALNKLGKLLRKSKLNMVCPIQVYLNILASLPKKTGDTRTVAIMATYYRLLMELDNQRLEDFGENNAYCKPSLRKEASAEYVAEERALEAGRVELEHARHGSLPFAEAEATQDESSRAHGREGSRRADGVADGVDRGLGSHFSCR